MCINTFGLKKVHEFASIYYIILVPHNNALINAFSSQPQLTNATPTHQRNPNSPAHPQLTSASQTHQRKGLTRFYSKRNVFEDFFLWIVMKTNIFQLNSTSFELQYQSIVNIHYFLNLKTRRQIEKHQIFF